MVELLLCIFIPLICVGVACWADVSSQQHIINGHNEAMKKLRGEV
jgi:hypothetical protein